MLVTSEAPAVSIIRPWKGPLKVFNLGPYALHECSPQKTVVGILGPYCFPFEAFLDPKHRISMGAGSCFRGCTSQLGTVL